MSRTLLALRLRRAWTRLLPSSLVPRSSVQSAARTFGAEWTKLRTAGGTGWLLLAVVVLTAAVGAAAAGSVTCHAAGGCGQDPAKLSLTGVYLGQAVAAIIAVLAIGGEYSTGMIRLTFAAMPRRLSVLAAKAAVVTGLVLAAGTAAAAGSRSLAGASASGASPLARLITR